MALVVDDEEVVRTVVRRMLERSGWEVVECGTAEQALDVLADSTTWIDVVLCDLNLPGMSGSALTMRIAAARPELASRVILTSGDAGAVEGAASGRLMLAKPFSMLELESVVAAALAG